MIFLGGWFVIIISTLNLTFWHERLTNWISAWCKLFRAQLRETLLYCPREPVYHFCHARDIWRLQLHQACNLPVNRCTRYEITCGPHISDTDYQNALHSWQMRDSLFIHFMHVSNSWWAVQRGSSPMRWDLREVLPPLIANHLIKKILSSLNNAYAQLTTEKVEDDFENKFSPLEIWTSYSLAPSESEIQILCRLSQSVPVRPVKGWSKQWWDLFVNSEFGVIYGP